MHIYKNFINHEFIDPQDCQGLSVYDPSTEALIAQTSLASLNEVNRAADAAASAQKIWRKTPSVERGRHLHKLADALLQRLHSIAAVLSRETGKSLADASNEVRYAAEITRYHAEWARRIEGELIPSDNQNETLWLQREPIGVVACLIPFNYPVYILLRKIAPALITGNSVLVRPSNHTPCSAFEVAKAIVAAGIPAGLIHIMTMNHDVAASLCTHPKVGMITLTGSLAAGRQILAYSQKNIAKTSLELGGKTPALVLADADLEKAAREIAQSATTHCGQLCTAVRRVYVQESVHDRFLALLKSCLKAQTFGSRQENPEHIGPLISQEARLQVHHMLERAVSAGACLELGGYLPEGPGFFYPPSLLSHCEQGMEIVQEELFGPVLTVLKCKNAEDALELANDHQLGLASVLYSENYRTALSIANNIEAGELYINRTPGEPYQGYHAGHKRSGLGGDDGKHGMLEFTQTRLVVMPY